MEIYIIYIIYINRKRSKKVWMENSIKKEDWERHFKNLLGIPRNEQGMKRRKKERVKRYKKGRIIRVGERNRGIGRKGNISNNQEKGKAAGIDEIPMKAWIYGGTALRKKISRDYKASLEDRSNTEGLENKRYSSDI